MSRKGKITLREERKSGHKSGRLTEAQLRLRDEITTRLQYVVNHIDEVSALSEKDKKFILKRISLVRFHMSQQRGSPSLAEIHKTLFGTIPVDEMVSWLTRPEVDTWVRTQYPTALLSFFTTVLPYDSKTDKKWKEKYKSGGHRPPSTFYLPDDHPDKTDQFGVPYYKSTTPGAKKWREKRRQQEEMHVVP